MNHRQGKSLYWEDEDAAPGTGTVAGHGDDFWRAVWKGIEQGRSARRTEPPAAHVGLEPPRDYVIEAEHGLSR